MALTRREMFEKVKAHLLKQNQKAMIDTDEGIACRYRTPEGLTCAIGCLIPDDEYDESFEGHPPADATTLMLYKDRISPDFSTDIEIQIALAAGITPETADLARRLQHCHDNVSEEEWIEKLNQIEREEFL